jgi:hypothetical protein
MNKKLKLGKVVGQVHGRNIRIMLESKSFEKEGRDGKFIRISSMCDTGNLGVYAGKKLLKGDCTSIIEATEFVEALIAKKK